jgi:hypothetical protein
MDRPNIILVCWFIAIFFETLFDLPYGFSAIADTRQS